MRIVITHCFCTRAAVLFTANASFLSAAIRLLEEEFAVVPLWAEVSDYTKCTANSKSFLNHSRRAFTNKSIAVRLRIRQSFGELRTFVHSTFSFVIFVFALYTNHFLRSRSGAFSEHVTNYTTGIGSPICNPSLGYR